MTSSASRHLWCAVIVTAVGLTMSVPSARARGFLYRSAATGRWTKLASVRDPLPPDSAFASETFTRFLSSKAKAPIASIAGGICGPDAITLAAFTAAVSRISKNTGIFLFDAATASIHDVAIEGTAMPLGGEWDTFAGNPDLAIDAEGCVAHVVFRGRTLGGEPLSMDTGVFDARFALPGLAATGTVVVAQEGVTTPGAPLPSTAVLSEVRPPVSLAVSDSPGVGVLIGFPVRVTDSAVTSADDTGILAIGSGGPSVLLREGDPSCVPPWTNGGTMYNEFADTQPLSVAVLGGPSVLIEAHSLDGATPDAIVLNSGGCSGTTTVLATAGDVAPGGSTFTLSGPSAPLDLNAGGDAAFVATTIMPGELASRRTLIRSSTGLVAREQLANTSLGPAVKLSGIATGPGMNAASDLVFGAKILPQLGLFFAAGGGSAPELLTFGGTNPQMDDFGNMTASF